MGRLLKWAQSNHMSPLKWKSLKIRRWVREMSWREEEILEVLKGLDL